jgi:hypothetical protein
VPKDVAMLTGKSEGHARRLVRAIKNKLNKSRNDMLSVEEFCSYTKLSPEEVSKALNK